MENNKINKQQYKITDSSVLGRSPAAVYMDTGVIEINKDIWHRFTPYERAFIIHHERGHHILPTEFEKEADAYALLETFKINKHALKDAINALAKTNLRDKSRLNALYSEAQLIQQNSQTSYKKVNLNQYNMRKKRNQTDNPFIKYAAFDGIAKGKRKKNKKKYFDDKNPPVTTTTYGKSHKINGFAIGNLYFSMTNILLITILISFLLLKKNRICLK